MLFLSKTRQFSVIVEVLRNWTTSNKSDYLEQYKGLSVSRTGRHPQTSNKNSWERERKTAGSLKTWLAEDVHGMKKYTGTTHSEKQKQKWGLGGKELEIGACDRVRELMEKSKGHGRDRKEVSGWLNIRARKLWWQHGAAEAFGAETCTYVRWGCYEF